MSVVVETWKVESSLDSFTRLIEIKGEGFCGYKGFWVWILEGDVLGVRVIEIK